LGQEAVLDELVNAVEAVKAAKRLLNIRE